jgi:hypothetical protein
LFNLKSLVRKFGRIIMKKTSGKLKFLLQLVVVLSMLGFYSAVHAQAIVVGLQVNADQDGLEITTRGNCKKSPNPNGCIYARGAVQINFNLPNARCSDNESWQLDQVMLGNSDKGEPGNISSTAANDFDADQASGVVTPVASSANHILIQNNNSAVYDIWYTVSASCGGETIYTDPRIENGGSE